MIFSSTFPFTKNQENYKKIVLFSKYLLLLDIGQLSKFASSHIVKFEYCLNSQILKKHKIIESTSIRF